MERLNFENGKWVKIETEKYIYASPSQIEGCYWRFAEGELQHQRDKALHDKAISDGWIGYEDELGFTRYKRIRSSWKD